MSAELDAMTIPAFIKMPRAGQHIFLDKIKISELKSNLPLLRKFVALKVLMEARSAVKDKSSFNLTAQFRNFLASFGVDELKLHADRGISDKRTNYPEEYRGDEITKNGYRLFHISDMGHRIWTRKFFNIGIDNYDNIVTQKVKVKGRLNKAPKSYVEDLETWQSLNKYDLEAVFAAIKEESSYENSFGYDLFCAAMFCANGLLLLNYLCATELNLGIGLLLIPFVLTLNLAIYAVTLPPALTFIAIEYCLVNPIKWVVNATTPDQYQAFIEEVTSAVEGEENDDRSSVMTYQN
ncbi:hypothetical protein [Legionella sp.]|uniref:hypothetical protein n=1 Tax=Legionella sp. TaxID=459 RepID=UPI000CB7453F|nr:hypothetical protein [Legionella sp.]PJE09843.1 MAG: hypothetical protein CK430_10810 [Legionella sp.]